MTTRQKLYFLYMDGTIRHQYLGKCLRKTTKTFNTKHEFKKVSWEDMHIQTIAKGEYVSRAVFDLLNKYGIFTSVFNCANLEVFGFCHLYDNDVETAREHGCKVIEVD